MSTLPARRILVPVDLSHVSVLAWRWARAFAAHGAHLEALYVHETPATPVLGLPGLSLSAAGRARIMARMRKAYPGGSVRVEQGDPSVVICRHARRFDLVVMGSHARRGIDRALLGSVCETVVRDAPVPVLSVKSGPRKVSSVLAPVNTLPYSRKGLLLAANAAEALGTTLTVLYVAQDKTRGPNPRFFINGMLSRLPEGLVKAVRPKLVLRTGEPLVEILKESRRHGLVVLTAHRKSLLRDLVLGTTAERVLRYAKHPVLSAPSGR